MKGGGKGKKHREDRRRRQQQPRYGASVPANDRSWIGTDFGPPPPAPPRRRGPGRACKLPIKVKGLQKHERRIRGLAKRCGESAENRPSSGFHRDGAAKRSVMEKWDRRKCIYEATMDRIPEDQDDDDDDDDDTEEAVLPPDEHDAWGSHGGDEPGSGSPPGITA